jgi:hypothetical protein
MYLRILMDPSGSKVMRPASFDPCEVVVTVVTAAVPWRLWRPNLKDKGHLLWLSYALLYCTHPATLACGKGTDEEGRCGLGDALAYAPRACPVAAVGRVLRPAATARRRKTER